MSNFFSTYARNFAFYNKNNETGFVLAFVTVAFVVLIGGSVVIAAAVNNIGLSYDWWAMLPTMFIVVTAAHFLIRPLVSAKYHGNQ